jgi:hypothetical protein
MTIGLAMIIKDEPVERLAMLVDYLKPVVSQFSITNTGDITMEDCVLIESWGVDLDHLDWTNDFSAARNHSASKLTTDWVLHLDADELPSIAMMEFIEQVTGKQGYAEKRALGYLFYTKNFWGGEIGPEMPNDWNWHCRLFRREAGKWYKPVHEQVRLNGQGEDATRGTNRLPKSPQSAYIIHSKPQSKIAASHEQYVSMGGTGIVR